MHAFKWFYQTDSFMTSKVVKPLASRDWKLYEGKDILELDARGLLLEARCSGLEACCSLLEELGA
jgi:hypothetical protein